MSGQSLVLRPAAKVNFNLRVGPRRPDGFHDVRTVLQSIALGDRLTLTRRKGPLGLETDTAGVPADATNLVWHTADLLWRALGRRGPANGVRIVLEKGIPAGAGLGGGSADAAAALVGLNALWSGRLARRDLVPLAAELGSDVPFFLVGGTALGMGRGEDLYPLSDGPRLTLMVIVPGFSVLTADAYRWLDEDRSRGVPAAVRPTDLDLGWPTGPLALVNDLQGPVCRRHPGVAKAIAALQRAGAQPAAMSGSGSSVFGVFRDPAAAQAARRQLASSCPDDWRLLVTRPLPRRDALKRIAP